MVGQFTRGFQQFLLCRNFVWKLPIPLPQKNIGLSLSHHIVSIPVTLDEVFLCDSVT